MACAAEDHPAQLPSGHATLPRETLAPDPRRRKPGLTLGRWGATLLPKNTNNTTREATMADGSLAGVNSLKGKVSAEEWQARVDLAALYRLVALYGWRSEERGRERV